MTNGTGSAARAGKLAGRVALVTGASRRIGRATVLGLAEAGADVVVHARSSRDEIEAVAEEARARGARALTVMGDVAKEGDVEAIFKTVEAEFGRLDILVNNAAIRGQAPFLEMSYAQWRATLGVILDGAFLCSRAALGLMVPNCYGTIVNLGGMTAHTGAINRAQVSAAKAGLVGLTKALAMEFADRGITVNCVAPGKIGGPRAASAGVAPKVPGEKIPLGRDGTIEEAAFMILTLCMPEARFMTGQTVHVSGGLYLP
ncbi:MAG: SDR family oxidoreductase [Pseudomonadota bacterium]